KPRTRSALAPTYAVVTVMAAFSLRGYWRTFSERIAWTPAIRIRRLTTSATTGRRMKRSVNFMSGPLRPSLIDGFGRHLDLGRELVLHHYGGVVAQLEGAAGDDGLALGDAGDDLHQVALALAQADELLPGDQGSFAGVVLLFFHREDGVAIRRVEHGGGGDDQDAALVRRQHLHVDEHAGTEAPVR